MALPTSNDGDGATANTTQRTSPPTLYRNNYKYDKSTTTTAAMPTTTEDTANVTTTTDSITYHCKYYDYGCCEYGDD